MPIKYINCPRGVHGKLSVWVFGHITSRWHWRPMPLSLHATPG